MKKQVRDLLSIAFIIFAVAFLSEMILAVPFYILAFALGNGYPISDLLFASTVCVLIAEFVIFFPLLLLSSRHLKDDPFRYSSRLEAYFRLSEGFDTKKLVGVLQANFFIECREDRPRKVQAAWVNPELPKDPRVFNRRKPRRVRYHPITIEILDARHGFKEQHLKVTVATCAPIKLFNSEGANQTALQALMDTLGWERYRVPVDGQGLPLW